MPAGNPNWVKGMSSPNPSGRKKGFSGLIRELGDDIEVAQALWDCLRGKAFTRSDGSVVYPEFRDRRWAIQEIANRLFGPPPQKIEMDITSNEPLNDAEAAEAKRLLELSEHAVH
jgi:hypothetical protein